MFKKITIATALALVALTSTSYAEPMVGKKLVVNNSYGQPFCTEQDDLREFLTAMLTKDSEALVALQKEGNCAMLKKGTAVSVLDDLGEVDEEMHGIKVRAMQPGKTSAVGYSLSIGMDPRK